MSARQLARHLEGFGIKSGNLRIAHNVAKGYERSKFEDAFSRYLAVSPPLPGPLHPPHRYKPARARVCT